MFLDTVLRPWTVVCSRFECRVSGVNAHEANDVRSATRNPPAAWSSPGAEQRRSRPVRGNAELFRAMLSTKECGMVRRLESNGRGLETSTTDPVRKPSAGVDAQKTGRGGAAGTRQAS